MSVHNIALQRVEEIGWRSGFTNFLSKEIGVWWRTRKWWVQSLVWFFVLNGMVVLLLWIVPALDGGDSPPVREVYDLYFNLFVISIIGVLILMQGVIVNEKQSGTAAWVLSNPLSRAAFILAKFVAHTASIFLILVLLQSTIAYLQFTLKGAAFLRPGLFIAAMGVHSLHLLFYITLALFLGAIFKGRGPVIGISLALFFLQDIARQLLVAFVSPEVTRLFPAVLADLAPTLADGGALPTPVPVLATALYAIALLAAAIWRFGREEF